MKISEIDKRCAKELKLLRKKHNLGQKELFENLGLATQQQYSDLENGKKHFTQDLILKICALFHVSILQFVNDQSKSFNLSVILNKEDYQILENSMDSETKLLVYKKLFLELKIENIENRLKSLHKEVGNRTTASAKQQIHVLI